ncbi:MAG: helix-turn-helix domain-containing protein [Muribaculaceae bacterium]|nr:helix-turn-helix domain-containing protein [Muribaculaceae bacterium]
MRTDKTKLYETAVEENLDEQILSADINTNRSLYKASMKIAMKIKRALRTINMSQLQLAHKMGMDPATLSRCLSGKANMELRTLVKFEEVLGITIIDRSISPYSKSKQDIAPSFHIKIFISTSELPNTTKQTSRPLLSDRAYNRPSTDPVYKEQQQVSKETFYAPTWS